MNPEDIHTFADQARSWGQRHYPDASSQHHAAFANSAVYARFRFTGPFGGPSVREHIANALINSALTEWETAKPEEIYLFLSSPIYGALTEEHLRFWQKYGNICHDDDPEDLRILALHTERNKFTTTRVWSSTLDNMRRVAALREESIVETWDRLAKEELARLKQGT